MQILWICKIIIKCKENHTFWKCESYDFAKEFENVRNPYMLEMLILRIDKIIWKCKDNHTFWKCESYEFAKEFENVWKTIHFGNAKCINLQNNLKILRKPYILEMLNLWIYKIIITTHNFTSIIIIHK